MPVIVNFNLGRKCAWCNSKDCFKCTCGKFTCIDCLRYPTNNGCVHKKYDEIVSDGWILQDLNVE